MNNNLIKFRYKYSPGVSSYRDTYEEIRWDVMGCNLQCQFCWSPASNINSLEKAVLMNPEEIVLNTVNSIKNPNKTFIRFTGGEPMLYWDQLFEVLKLFEKNKIIANIPILFQTNGIEIGNGNADVSKFFAETNLTYLFELSFKGTNQEEFSLLSQKSHDLYRYQVNAFNKLNEISKVNNKVIVIAVLGIYHSSIHNAKYVFVNPENEELLFENYSKWDKDFSKIWTNANLKWVETLRMSPIGVWKNTIKRCGKDGTRILRLYDNNIRVNLNGNIIRKPDSYKYVELIVKKKL